jgi:hypothetical protein
MAAKQAPSKAEKKHHSTAEKTAQPPKHIRKNRETTAEETTAEETTVEKNT